MIKSIPQEYTTAVNLVSSKKHQRIKPPFGYYGAKQRIASQIVASLPPHNAWVEAFCGSAALTLAKAPAPIEVINDLNGEIINLFVQLRENHEALCRAVALTPYARDEFISAQSRQSRGNPLERARRFLVSTMMAINATADDSQCGFSFSQSFARGGREARVNRWYKLPERLAEVVERLRTVRIENRDARELIKMFKDRPATLIYLDPPYFVKRNHGYVIDARDEKFHRSLLDECCRSRSMIIISGYDNALYKSILNINAGWKRVEIQTHTRNTTGKDYARTEILWKNAQYVKAEETGRIPIRLTRKEIVENKINPSRGA